MSQLFDCVLVRAEPYADLGRRDWWLEECRQLCLDVNFFVDRLADFGFREDEIPPPLIHAHRAIDLAIRTESLDNIVDFFEHVKWSQTSVEETINALEQIGADAHAHFLTVLHVYLKGIQYKRLTRFHGDEIDKEHADDFSKVIANATEEHLLGDIWHDRYGYRSIWLQAVRYMKGWTDIEIRGVPDGAWNDLELNRYFASRPAIVQRLKEIDDARPWEQHRIKRAIQRLGCKWIQWASFIRDDNEHWSWCFWTDQGAGFAIFDQTEMIIYRVGNPQKWFRADMPEEWTREVIPELLSGAQRNEPHIASSEMESHTQVDMPFGGTCKFDLPPPW
jgi:hypothetical protein